MLQYIGDDCNTETDEKGIAHTQYSDRQKGLYGAIDYIVEDGKAFYSFKDFDYTFKPVDVKSKYYIVSAGDQK